MANLSQQRRERMLAFLETLKEQHSDDDSLIAIGEIEKELKAKKTAMAAQKEELESLAQNILNIRDENFDMTLGEMYNPETMPEELREAHHQLDLAVEHIYRTEPFTSDEERLEHLFKLYAKMTKK